MVLAFFKLSESPALAKAEFWVTAGNNAGCQTGSRTRINAAMI